MGNGDPRAYETYARLIDRNGNAEAKAALARGERVILGLRTENSTFDSASPDNPRTRMDESRAGTGIYNDRIVVLWRDRDGHGYVETFSRANTEPMAQYDVHALGKVPKSRHMTSQNRREWGDGVDVNGDGKRDLGRWADGTTELKLRSKAFMGAPALMPTDAAVSAGKGRVDRDTNGDGWFTRADTNGVQDLNNTFYIHVGSRGNTDSSGCQTIHRDDYPHFLDTIRANPAQNRWQYVLVTVGSTMSRHVEASQSSAPVKQSKEQEQRPAVFGLNEPTHPDHALYSTILGKVHAEDGRRGRVPDACSDNLAGALTVACRKNGVERAEGLFFNEAGTRAFVVDAAAATSTRNWASVDVAQAVGQPLHRSEAMLAALQMDQPQAIVHRHNQVDPAPQLQVSGQASVPALAATR